MKLSGSKTMGRAARNTVKCEQYRRETHAAELMRPCVGVTRARHFLPVSQER
jgi:hypothetical protein